MESLPGAGSPGTISRKTYLDLRGWQIRTSVWWNVNWNLPLDACHLFFSYKFWNVTFAMSNLPHVKKASFPPTNVQLRLFSTITEKFIVLVKFNNLLLIVFNWGQRLGKKRKVTTCGINCGGSRKTRPAKPPCHWPCWDFGTQREAALRSPLGWPGTRNYNSMKLLSTVS